MFKSGNWKVEISDEIENCSKDEISKDEICRWNENCSADEISKDEICRWNENCSKDEIFQMKFADSTVQTSEKMKFQYNNLHFVWRVVVSRSPWGLKKFINVFTLKPKFRYVPDTF